MESDEMVAIAALAQEAAQPEIGWISSVWGVAMAVVAFVARRRFRDGWGEGASLARRGVWGDVLVRLGFALLPIGCAMGAFAVSAASMKLAFEHSDSFIAPAIIAVVVFIGFLGWAVKEFVNPGAAAPRPDWLDDFYEARGRSKGR